jgi:3',5'-cyclic AMP phosphodiesterase CpdA
MKLYAISDLHLANKPNRDALLNLHYYKNDWLILAGDIGETPELLKFALSFLTTRFKQIIWVPGNHDLWTFPLNENGKKGIDKYFQQVDICRGYHVLTPEDEYPLAVFDGKQYIIAPTFTLYDYSFRPGEIPFEQALDWAEESGVICTDEDLLFPHPYRSIVDWCHQRCEYTEKRLSELPGEVPIVLVNHYPVIEEHAKLWRFPRFTLWCGTKQTEAWMTRYNIKIVVYGHIHIRGTKYKDGVKFEEVSFGYPRDWDENKGMDFYLREIGLHEENENGYSL